MRDFSSLREQLVQPNAEILCAEVSLVPTGSMTDEPVVFGPGRFTFLADGQIRFELQATLVGSQAIDFYRSHMGYAWSLDRLHLHATDYRGMEYQGWIERARLAQDNLTNTQSIRIIGHLSMLQTVVVALKGPSRATVVYYDSPDVPLSTWRKTVSTHGEIREWFKSEQVGHKFDTAGTTISVLLDGDTRELEISATEGVGGYAFPSLEECLCQPFRALNGNGTYPRYVLRDAGLGTARLRIFPHEDWKTTLGGSRSTFKLIESPGYWAYFAKYLDFVASEQEQKTHGAPNHLTLLHDEVNRAVRGGSHWIVSLALSSAIEGLLRKHPSWRVKVSPVTTEQRTSAEATLSSLDSDFLRSKLSSALAAACRDQQPNGSFVLKALVLEGVIEDKHKKAWENLRHYVSHGNLLDHRTMVSRMDHFDDLHELFQLLTAKRIGFTLADYPLSDSGRARLQSYKNATGDSKIEPGPMGQERSPLA